MRKKFAHVPDSNHKHLVRIVDNPPLVSQPPRLKNQQFNLVQILKCKTNLAQAKKRTEFMVRTHSSALHCLQLFTTSVGQAIFCIYEEAVTI